MQRPFLGSLACLGLALLALSGHVRRLDGPARADLDGTVAEVLVRRNGEVVARGSAVAVAMREEDGESVCYLLTAGHILSLGGALSDVVVVLPPDRDRPRRLTGELLYQADGDDRDLAVLRTVSPCRPVPVGAPVEPGGDVWLAGFAVQGTPRVWSGHVRDARADAMRWTVDGLVSEGTSGGGVFDARTGDLVGLIQGYWTVRLITDGGRVAGEVPTETAVVIPISRVRTLLQEWGIADLLDRPVRQDPR